MLSIDQGLAFLEGLALIASPCILPILPLVLSASIDGGKARPVGIIVGFITAFCLFAFFSRWIVAAIGIDLDDIKYASLFLLTLLGIVMISSRLSEKFSTLTQGVANSGGQFAANNDGGFFSGLGIGVLIGLIWTPCAGPILAAVLVQVIRQQNNLQGFLTMVCFAIGAGIPMLVIAFTGRTFMTRLTFFKRHAQALRKALGVIILLSVYVIASGMDPANLFKRIESPAQGESMLSHPYPAPAFSRIDTWLNSPPLTMEELKGKVVLIDFWTYSCINCVRTLPFITGLDKKYRDKGLIIVGVHSPEFEFEKNVDNVKHAIEKNGIHYAVAIDNTLSTWDSFHNHYWPAQYLINKDGQVVFTHFGEGDEATIEANIQSLLGIQSSEHAAAEAEPLFHPNQTPETYLGDMRSERFSKIMPGSEIPLHYWSTQGHWTIASEKIVSQGNDATLWIHFNAQKVFLVMGTATGQPIEVTLLLNGQPAGKVIVDRHTLYPLLDQGTFKPGMLEIKANAPGLEMYAFTFG